MFFGPTRKKSLTGHTKKQTTAAGLVTRSLLRGSIYHAIINHHHMRNFHLVAKRSETFCAYVVNQWWLVGLVRIKAYQATF